jgi:16S rRNA (cytosine967-C5)-methyltransferase
VLNYLLPDEQRAYVTKVVRGVCERNIEFDYIISKCADKIKPAVMLIIKIGLYLLRYTDAPDYAAVNDTVELAKSVGKGGIAGFVNAVLRKSAEIDFPDKNNLVKYLSIKYSLPEWAVKNMINDYGADTAEELAGALKEEKGLTHIRFRPGKEGGLTLPDIKTDFGYYVTHNTLKRLNEIRKNEFFAQNLGSIYICQAIKSLMPQAEKILDACAAPGGKSVLLSELYPAAQITACDIHPHRIKLTEGYIARAEAKNITALLNDATVCRKDFDGAFDIVLCDVPCSGFGVLSS